LIFVSGACGRLAVPASGPEGGALKRILFTTLAFSFVLTPGIAFGQRREVRVTAAQAAVQDAPRANALVLTQLPRGKSLFATGRTQGDWLEIESPSEVSGWIFGELLRGDVVEASSVRVRSGAGVGFEGLGTLVKGDRITRRGSQGGWVEFEGIPAMRVWVERSMVSAPAAVDLTAAARPAPAPVAPREAPVDPPPRVAPTPAPPPVAAVAEPAPPPAPPPPPPVQPATPAPVRVVVPPPPVRVAEAEPVAVVRPAVPPPAAHPAPVPIPPVMVPARQPEWKQPLRVEASESTLLRAKSALPPGFRLLGHLPQGHVVRMEGVVRPVGIGLFRPTDHRLIPKNTNVPGHTTAYLVSNEVNLSRHIGRNVVLSGVRFWLMGVREPVVVVQSVN
jgi:hypothetical protein